MVAAYFWHLGGDYIGDDTGRIELLYSLHKDIHPLQFMYNSLGDRPLLILSVYFDMYILGFDALGMRIENLLLFCLLVLILRILIDALAQTFGQKINGTLRDLLLFILVVHPLNVQAVGNIIQRGIILSTLFGLVSTLLILRSRGNPRTLTWKVSLLIWGLALLFKPNIVFLPFWWALLLYYMGEKRNIRFLFFFVLMLSIPVMGYVWGGYNPQVEGTANSSFIYFLTQAGAIARYLKLMIFPWPLYFMHDLSPVALSDYLPHLLLWFVYLSFLTVFVIKVQNKAIKLFVIGGVLAFVPESSFFPIIHLFFEHRAFVPLAFFISSLVFILPRYDGLLLRGSLLSLLIGAGSLTYLRSLQVRHYKDWVLHEARPSLCQYPYFSFYVVNQLLLKKEVAAAQRAFDQVGGGCPNDVGTDILKEEFKLQKLEKISFKDIQPLRAVLHSNSLATCAVRNLSNTYFISLVNTQPNFSCLIEDMISNQLRFLVAVYPNCSIDVVHYKINADQCLEDLRKSGKEHTYRALKIRTIRYVYFHEKEESLKEDLKKFPASKKFDYLRNMIQVKDEYTKLRR